MDNKKEKIERKMYTDSAKKLRHIKKCHHITAKINRKLKNQELSYKEKF